MSESDFFYLALVATFIAAKVTEGWVRVVWALSCVGWGGLMAVRLLSGAA